MQIEEHQKVCNVFYFNTHITILSNFFLAKLNRKESAIEDCTKAIELSAAYVKAYLRRAKLYEDTDKLDESLADYKKISELDQGNKDALEAQMRLPPLINEKNEKLKEEMLGKLG